MGLMDFCTRAVDRVIKQYKLKPLFKNQFSDIYSDESSKYILKIFNMDRPIERKEMYLAEVRYLGLFSKMENIKRHIPQIIQSNDKEGYILMENKGRDGIILINDGAYDEKVFEDFLNQIPPVLEAIFKSGYVHRDIKPENMVYDSETETWSIIDFAFTEPSKFTGKKLPFRGTYPYCAPFLGNKMYLTEFLKYNKREDLKVCADYFSFALTAFALEGNEHRDVKLDKAVEISIIPAIEVALNPNASPVKKALANIVLSCVDLKYTTIKWYYVAQKGRHCKYDMEMDFPELKNMQFERNMIKCWETFMSIIEKQKILSNSDHVQTENKPHKDC